MPFELFNAVIIPLRVNPLAIAVFEGNPEELILLGFIFTAANFSAVSGCLALSPLLIDGHMISITANICCLLKLHQEFYS